MLTPYVTGCRICKKGCGLRDYKRAHEAGIDFTNCSEHTGNPLPIEDFEISYLNEKLDCIFNGRFKASNLTAPD